MRVCKGLLLCFVVVLWGCGAQSSLNPSQASTQQPASPLAVAGGPYAGIAGTAVAFSGAGSLDPQGQALAYAWNFGDGGAAFGISPTHIYSMAGTYAVSLTVTDTTGLSATATSKATITAAPQPPVASAGGPYAGTAGTAVSFSGTGSLDPQGQTLAYAWNFGDGTMATGLSPTHIYTTAGNYAVLLTVTDTIGLSATATSKATITAAPQPPVASAGGPYAGTAGTAVSFSGTGSLDPQGQTLAYAWNFGDGTMATGLSPTHIYTTAGNYAVLLTVTDTIGLSATATSKATITAAPGAPLYVVCTTWGDSLTQGNEDGSGITIATVLASLGSCGVVNNQGGGGQTSTQIAIRQGGVTTTGSISGSVIPPNGGVQITFPVGYEVGTSQGPASIPMSISGVMGAVTYNPDGTHTFTRSVPGAAIYSLPNSVVTVDTGTLNSGFNLIWVGRNNYHDVSQVLSDVAGMVSNLPSPKHFLIMSVLNSEYLFEWNSGGGDYDTLISLNQSLANAYPDNYVDIRKMLIQRYDPTNTQDVLDFSHDVPPSSLRAIDFNFTLPVPVADTMTCNFGDGLGGRYAWTFLIDNEKVLVTGTQGDSVSQCIRGYANTIAAVHSAGTAVQGIDCLHLNGTPADTFIGHFVNSWIQLHPPSK